MKRAVIAYQEEKEKRPGEKQRGLRSICMEMRDKVLAGGQGENHT